MCTSCCCRAFHIRNTLSFFVVQRDTCINKMAEGGHNREKLTKSKLLEQLTCSVCIDIYQDPRLLPCQHTYCATPTCLGGLLKTARNNSIFCPQCRSQVAVQGTNMDIFPKDFKMNSLKEIYQEILESEQKTLMCSLHKNQELVMYCETCTMLICRDCYILEHKDHNKGYVSELAPKYRKELAIDLRAMTEATDLSNSLNQTQRTLEQAENNHSELHCKIDECFEVLIQTLLTQKQELKAEIDEELLPVIERLKKQKATLSVTTEKISSTTTTGREISALESDVLFMEGHESISMKLQELKKAINKAKTFPSEQHKNLDVTILDRETLVATCREHTSLLKPTTQIEVAADISSLSVAELYQELTVPLTIATSSLVKLEIQCSLQLSRNDASVGQATIVKETPQRCSIVIVPQQRGRHRLGVTVNGQHITGSPFSFKVKVPLTELGSRLKEHDCDKPCGLTTLKDKICLLEEGKRGITVFEDHKPTGFMPIEETRLAEMAVHKKTGDMFVTTGETHKVLKLNRNGELIHSIDSVGNGPLDLGFTNGVCISRSDELYVCDTQNHDLKVFDLKLNLLRIINGKENAFQCPRDVELDRQDNIYIADNTRIQVLSRDGSFVRTFGEGKIRDAVCLKIVGSSVFLTNYGEGCISIYSTDGEFVRDIALDQNLFDRPQGITVDNDGFVYVSTFRGKLLIF